MAASAVLRVRHQVGHVVDRREGRLGRLEDADHLVEVVLRDPAADRRVELVGVLGPLLAALEPGLSRNSGWPTIA